MPTRRRFLTQVAASGVLPSVITGAYGKAERRDLAEKAAPAGARSFEWSQIRGFNYRPTNSASYAGSSSREEWENFNTDKVRSEISKARECFPGINALRWFQSWDQYQRDPDGYARKFETSLSISNDYGCKVVPVLFNRHHDEGGGIYIDHFLPGSFKSKHGIFDRYLEAIVGNHRDDPRILSWDLCNEPYMYKQTVPLGIRDYLPGFHPADSPTIPRAVVEAETAWLKSLYDNCKKLKAQAPITVGTWMAVPLEQVASFLDVLSIHPYYLRALPQVMPHEEVYEHLLDAYVEVARKLGKPLVANECCWGSENDRARVQSMRFELTQLKKRKIGFLACKLYDDNQHAEFSFISADRTLRSGHEAFNEF